MKPPLIHKGLLLLVALLWTESAKAHGIAGNRYFDGTMTFDDPAVADEAIVPNFSYLGYPTQGSNVVENRINWSFARLLTPTLEATLDSGWIHQNWPVGHTSGFDKTNLGLKYEAYRDNQHEALVSVSLAWGQPFDDGFGVIANTLLDSDEQVILLFETIFEGLVVDDLHGLGAHATPARGPVSDNVGRKEINRRHSAVDQVGCGHLVRGSAFNCGGAVHAITSRFRLLLSSRHLLIRNSSPT